MRSRLHGFLLPLIAPLIVLAFDWAGHPFLFHGYGKKAAATYVGTALLSAAMWWAWASLVAQERRVARIVGAIVLVGAGTLLVGAQRYVVDRFGVLVDENYVVGVGGYSSGSMSVLLADKWTAARAVLPPLLAFGALAFVLDRWRARGRLKATPLRFAAPIAVITTFVAVEFVTPSRYAEGAEPLDILVLSAIGRAAREDMHGPAASAGVPGRRSPQAVPAITAGGGRRNVVLIVSESLRADMSGDAETPFSRRATPNRVTFPQMHALASNTTPSIIGMWTGLSPAEAREELHSAPLVWDYAHAAGYDTAYWTAQDLTFGNLQVFFDGIPARLRVSAAELDRERDSLVGADERLLAAHIEAHLAELREPFFAVVHLSNTHLPYRVDADDVPWLPQSTEGTNGNETAVMNRYRDAIYAQDKLVARMIGAFRAHAPTVFVFTSDHGEQFREHGAVGHSLTLSEPEVHVPFWVDAPTDSLSTEQHVNLVAASSQPLTHAMVVPTLLDLMGVLDAPEIASFRSKMLGASLLRPLVDLPAIVMTNCSGVLGCPRPAWGAMKGGYKVWANDADRSWQCHDLLTDPDEKHQTHGPKCDELASLAEGSGRGVPFRTLE